MMKNLSVLILTLTLNSEAVTVNSPITITHEVHVNPIRVQNTSGEKANYLGTSAQEEEILEKVNQIWAQAGIQVVWGEMKSYTNNFAYDDDGTSYPPPNQQNQNRPTRSTNHLSQIVNNAGSVRGDNTDINVFFVKTSPGGYDVNDFSFSGLGFVDGPSLTVAIGSQVYGSADGRSRIANLIAHEIGHNLGLQHLDNGQPFNPGAWPNNLMTPGPTTQQLNLDQKDTVFDDDPRFLDGFDLLTALTQPLTNYENFAISNNLTGNPSDDDDGDDLSNLLEFALNTDPNNHTLLPEITRPSESDYRWSITKNTEAIEDGFMYRISVSDNLQTWNPAGTNGTGSSIITDNSSTLTARVQNREHSFFTLEVLEPTAADIASADVAELQVMQKTCDAGCCHSH